MGFPISRDPPEGGTPRFSVASPRSVMRFPISRDPPEGGTPGGTPPPGKGS